MLAIARAILTKPHYLLADEPLLGLSDGPREQVWQALMDLCSMGVGLLVTGEHNVPNDAVIDQIKTINNGKFQLEK